MKLHAVLTDSIRTEPFLISHLVRIAMVANHAPAGLEGLAEHQWSDAQLAELDAELAKLDFLADYEMSMRGEMILWRFRKRNICAAAGIFNLDYSENGSHDNPASQLGFRLAPASFFYQNELTIAPDARTMDICRWWT